MIRAAALRSQFPGAFDRLRRPAPECLSTGISAVDQLTGGVLRGSLTEIFGAASSGRTSLLVSLLAQATARQEYCALIDAGNSFDPVTAAKTGVRLGYLLWIRCDGNAEHALKVTDLLVQSGGFGLVAMDLASVPPVMARRISLASWFRLRHAVERTSTALVVVEQNLNAPSCSQLQLEMRQKQILWRGRLLAGVSVETGNRKKFVPSSAAHFGLEFNYSR